MDNVMIKNAQGEQLNINVVRYFRLNETEYLVFSLNEVDEGGYVKLYISKLNGEIANTITDDVEWNLIKDTVKTIIKSNKENLPLPITDLDLRKIGNLQVLDQKVFKLSEAFIQLLGANKNPEAYIESETSLSEEITGAGNATIENGLDLNSIQSNPIVESVSPMPTLAVTEDVVAAPIAQPIVDDLTSPVNTMFPTTVQAPVEVAESNEENNFSDLGNNADYGLDYKTLYDNELNKNKLLSEEIEKYKSIINNLKNILNETETF